ncbi:hypothetical protein BU25DRAFT_324640, partial [Macroventuria anomochaeta]
LDHQNPHHERIDWTYCAYDPCTIHYQEKVDAGWFPSPRTTCLQPWYKCTNDVCEIHLIDKRSKLHFLGTEDPQAVVQMQLV